jgi:hypothetical protein
MMPTPEIIKGFAFLLKDIVVESERFASMERTKREEILAQKDIVITKINSAKEILKLSIDKTFEERKSVMDKYFNGLDLAINENSPEKVLIYVNSINDILKTNPFNDIITASIHCGTGYVRMLPVPCSKPTKLY